MSSNSDSSNGSDKFKEPDGETERVPKFEHTGNKLEKTSETNVIKESLECKITEVLKKVSSDKSQARENLTIKVVPLNVRLSNDNVSYYKITTQVVEDSILKTIVTPIWSTCEQQENEETQISKSFITCSKHLRLLLGALSPAYRPQLIAGKHSQPVLRKISGQKELKQNVEDLKNRDSVAELPHSVTKSAYTKLIFGTITPSYATKQLQKPPNIQQKEHHVKDIVPEAALHNISEIKMTNQNNTSTYSLSSCRQKLYKKQYKHVRAMQPRNEQELKMKERLLKLLHHLKQTAEETENIIKAFYHQNDIEHLQEYFNTQLNKSTSSDEFQSAYKRYLDSLENQNEAHQSIETKKLRETKEHQQMLDISKEKQKDMSSYRDRKYRDVPEDTQSQSSIRSAKDLSEDSKPVDITSTESKRKDLNPTREILLSKEQKPIKIILQKVENRKRTMKLWNDNDYIFDKVSHNSNDPHMPTKENEIQDHKRTVIADNAQEFNDSKSNSSGNISKEKSEHDPSWGDVKHPNEKPDSEENKIPPIEQICIIEKSSSKSCNQSTNTRQLIPLLPKASLDKAHEIGNQNIKFKENKDQTDKGKIQDGTAQRSRDEQKVNVKVSKSKMTSQKLPAVKREILRLSRTIRQKGRVCTYCKPRTASQKLPLIAAMNKVNSTKTIRSKGHTESRLNETKAIGSLSNNSTDKTKPKETETELKGRPPSEKNEKPFSSNESNVDMSKSAKQNVEVLKSKSSTVTETSTKPQSSKESTSSSKKDLNSKQEEWNALKSKNDTTDKKVVLDRAAAKAELREIELQRKQELKELKEKLTRPKTTFSKSDAYYEYLQRKLKGAPHERQQAMKAKTSSVPSKNNKTTINKKAKTHAVAQKYGTERAKLDKHKSKVLSQKEIDQYFKCSSCSDKSYSGSDLTPMPKYGCHHSHLTYEDLKSVIKLKTDGNSFKALPQKTKALEAIPLKKSNDTNSSKTLPQKTKVLEANSLKKSVDGNSSKTLPQKTKVLEATPLKKSNDTNSCKTLPQKTKVLETTSLKKSDDGNSCKKLPQETKVLEATPLKKNNDSKPTHKEDKFTPILKASAEKDAENGNQNVNKKASCKENKMPEVQSAGEKINTESERKSKAKSITKTDARKSMQPEQNLLEPYMLHYVPEKGNSDTGEKQHTHIPRSDIKHTHERVRELYLFTATDTGRQILKIEQNFIPRKSVKEMTKLKDCFSTGMKHMQQFQKLLQNKLKRMGGAAEKNKAEELKAKQAIKKALLTNIHEAVKVKNLKEGFRNNFQWYTLKTAIQNSVHGRQLLNAVKQSVKSLCVGFKGSVDSKELRLAFREGIKPRELFYVVRQSINLPLLLRSLGNATKEYTKLKYNTFKKIQEESTKKDGGNNGAGNAPKQPSGENCNKHKGNAKHEARTLNRSQMLYRLNNTIYEQIAGQPLLTKDIRKLMTEILTSFPTLPLKTAECLQLPHIHKYISKHLTGLNSSMSYFESRPIYKILPTTKELAPFVLKSSDFIDDKVEQNSAYPNLKPTNVPSAASKEVKFFQGFWRNHGPKIVVKGQTNSDMYSKQNALRQLNAMTKAIYEADRNGFTTGLNRRLSLNQLLRDFFSPNEHSLTDRKTELNEVISENSQEEALRKLIHDNMHTVSKTCLSENSVHNANKTLKEKILLFFLKHDMIYVTEDMPKYLIPPISKNVSNKQNHISASSREIQSSSHKHSDPKYPKEASKSMHSSGDKGSAEANVTESEEKSKGEQGKPQSGSEPVRAKPEKSPAQHSSNETNLTGISKYFNSETINGRANVAKATLACVALGYLYYQVKKQSKREKDTKLLK